MNPDGGRLYPTREAALVHGVESPVEIVGTPEAVARCRRLMVTAPRSVGWLQQDDAGAPRHPRRQTRRIRRKPIRRVREVGLEHAASPPDFSGIAERDNRTWQGPAHLV